MLNDEIIRGERRELLRLGQIKMRKKQKAEKKKKNKGAKVRDKKDGFSRGNRIS